MDYSRTLVRTGELVWFPGAPRIEGITSPLWALLLADLQLVPISPARSGALVQLLGMAMLLCTLVLVYRLTMLGDNDESLALAATAVVAACYPVVYVALTGWEHSLVALLIVALAYIALERERWPLIGDLLIILGLLTRMDFLVAVVPISAYLVLQRKVSWIREVTVILLTLSLLTFWRWEYYGALLPNTWTLKMTGYPFVLRIARGLWVTLTDIWRWRVIIAVPFVALFAGGWREARFVLPCSVFVALAAYAVWVGGDAWHDDTWGSRYLIAALPLLVPLVVRWLDKFLRRLVRISEGSGPARALRRVAVAALVIVCLSPVNRVLLLHIPKARHWEDSMSEALLIRDGTRKSATVGVVGGGALPYFSERRCVDFLGKSDTAIARLRAHQAPPHQNPLTYYYPGHLKWSARHSIETMKPDIVTGTWGDQDEWLWVLRMNGYTPISNPGNLPLWVKEERAAKVIGPAAADGVPSVIESEPGSGSQQRTTR